MVLVIGKRGRVCGRWHAGARTLVIDLHGELFQERSFCVVDRGVWTTAPTTVDVIHL